MMKKAAIVLLLLAAAAAGAVPYWGGIVAQDYYEGLLDAVRRESQGRVEVSSSYQRGWLGSTARTVISMPSARGTRQLSLDQTITHGPLRFGDLLEGRIPREPILAIVDTTYTPELETYPRLRAALESQPLVRVRTTVHPGGGITSELVSPEITDDALGLIWRGATASLSLAPGAEKAWGSFEARGLELASNDQTVRVGAISGQFESKRSPHGLPLAELWVSLETLEVTDRERGSPAVAMREWVLTQLSEENESGMFRTAVTLRFEELSRKQERYGPGKVELVLRNLDAQALSRLRERQLELAEAELAPEERGLAVAAAIVESLRTLLTSSPEIELTHLSVRSQNGDLTARARIGVDGQNLPSLTDPMFLQRALDASAELRVPARIIHWIVDRALSDKLPPSAGPGADEEGSALRQVQLATVRTQLLQHLTSANVLTREGDSFGMRVVYRNAELLLNGQTFDPSALSGFSLPAGSVSHPESL